MKHRENSADKLPFKNVDNSNYISALIEIAKEGNEVSVNVFGNSMAPFLRDGRDVIVIGKKPKRFKKGDMAFFKRASGEYIMHRIYRIDNKGFYFVGDSQLTVEGPIELQRVLSKVVRVKRKGKWIKDGDFIWEFFRIVWIRTVKFRPIIFKLMVLLKG